MSARLAAALVAVAACGPKYDVAGPGALPAPVDERSGPTAAAPPPAPAPPPPPDDTDDAPPPSTGSADKPPPHANANLTAAKGSRVTASIQLVGLDDETHLIGTVTGLAKGGAYMLSKRDHCGTAKADDDSRRSNPVVYGIALTADASGVATIDDTAKAVHVDGPLAVVGAYLVVSKTAGSAELACGRVVGQ